MDLRLGTIWLVAAALLTATSPAAAQAPAGGERPGPDGRFGAMREAGDVLMRIGGPIRVPAGDTASTVVVVGGDAVVDGHVRERLVVVDGTARVTGTVAGDMVVAAGRAMLEPGARVGGDLHLHESQLAQAPGATIQGEVQRGFRFGVGALAGWFAWIAATTFLIVAGLLFAGLAGRQLREAAGLIRSAFGATALTALVVVVGLPILAVLVMFTVIGIPLGLAVLVGLLPLLALLGYLVAGDAIGAAVLRRFGGTAHRARASRPYLAVTTGVVVLQLVLLIPILGGLVALVASALGAGALIYRSWRILRERPPRAEAARRAA